MNMKKIFFTTLCVLTVTVAAQNVFAQSPSMEARYLGELLQGAFEAQNKTKAKADTAAAPQAEPVEAEPVQVEPAKTDTANQETARHYDEVEFWNSGREMKIVNSAEQVCKCIGEACKCAYNTAKKLVKEGMDNMPSDYIPGREGAIMRSGENWFKNKESKADKTATNSFSAALERANAKAARKHFSNMK